jgi:hypothetical protein
VTRLARIGIMTAAEFAEMGEADVWISFNPEARPFRAVLHTYTEGGGWTAEEFGPFGEGWNTGPGMHLGRVMDECVQNAMGQVEHPSGRRWEHGPFPYSWQTGRTRSKVLGYLERREAER